MTDFARAAVGPRPELAHRLVAVAGVGHVVKGRVAVGLDRELQPVLVGQLAEMAGVVLHQQVGNRLPQVPEEPLGDLHAIDDAAGVDGQVAVKVVAAAFLEFLAHPRRPVLRVDFPTVDVRGDERLAGQRGAVGDDLAHQPGEHGVGGLLAQLVAFQAAARGGGRGVYRAGRGVADPQHGPLARRHVPSQAAVLELGGEIDDGIGLDDLVGRHFRILGRGRRLVLAIVARLAVDILDPGVAGRRGEGQHGDVAIVVGGPLRLGQSGVEMLAAFHAGFRPDDVLHRQLGRDPGPAAAAPSGVVGHVDFQAQPVGLAEHVLEEFPPLAVRRRGRGLCGAP